MAIADSGHGPRVNENPWQVQSTRGADKGGLNRLIERFKRCTIEFYTL